MQPTFADFTTVPAKLGHVTLRHEHCSQGESHLALGTGGFVELEFHLRSAEVADSAILTVTASVAPGRDPWGFALLDVVVNGETLFPAFPVPDLEDPADMRLSVPSDRLVPGSNTVRLEYSSESTRQPHVHRITLDAPDEHGRSLRAVSEEDQPPSVFAFGTQWRADDGAWQDDRPLLVHLDRGRPTTLRQLSWRSEDGAEASVAFQSGMAEFYGYRRAADGTSREFRGRLTAGHVFPTGTEGAVVNRFHTLEGRDGEWRDAGDLSVLVQDGSGTVERVTWRDEHGDSGSIVLRMPTPGTADRDLTPLVTTVRADQENRASGEIAETLLDGPEHGKWLAFSDQATLQFCFRRPVCVRHYVLVSANDFSERDPREWTLEASWDTGEWTVLDSRSGQFFSERHQPRGFTLFNEGAFSHYRLRIRRTGGRETQLAQIRFFEAAPPALGFTGYYQPAGADAIGYRGSAPTTDTGTTAPRAARPGHDRWRGEPAAPFERTAWSEAALAAPLGEVVPKVAADPTPPTEPTNAAPAGPAPSPVTSLTTGELSTVDGWRAFLAGYSADFLRVADENERSTVDEEQQTRGWLGYEGASEADIAALEQRLGIPLPPDYRAFLGASDGWCHLGSSMWEMRTTQDVDWFRDAEEDVVEVLMEEDEELGALLERSLLVSREGDSQYWFLDPHTVSPDGAWAAYTWSAWGFLSDAYPSFAALVVEQRRGWEAECGRAGRPVGSEGVDELVTEGRALALRGEADAALVVLGRAADKGSGTGQYLWAVLDAFLNLETAHFTLGSKVLSHAHVVAAVGEERMRAEVVPLYLRAAGDASNARPDQYTWKVADYLPERGVGSPEGPDSEEYWRARREAFVPPVLPQPPAFQQALDRARALAAAGDPEGAWGTLRQALSCWYSDHPHSIAPVILLTDPAFREVITPRRARLIALTPRLQAHWPGN